MLPYLYVMYIFSANQTEIATIQSDNIQSIQDDNHSIEENETVAGL